MLALVCAILAVSADVEVRPLDGIWGTRDMAAGQVFVRNVHDTVHVLDGQPFIQPNAVEVYFKVYREKGQSHTAGFFNVNGKAERLAVSSTDDSVASIAYDQTLGFVATYKKAGSIHFVASLLDLNIKLPCKVIVLPLRKGDAATRVIDLLGLPSTKDKFYVGWPDIERVKGVVYVPRAGHPSHGEHWSFGKFPNAHLSIIDGKVHALGVSREETPADLSAMKTALSGWMNRIANGPAKRADVDEKTEAERERMKQAVAAKVAAESKRVRAAAAASLLALGKSFKARGDTASAQRRFEKIIAEYPESPAAAEAKELLGP